MFYVLMYLRVLTAARVAGSLGGVGADFADDSLPHGFQFSGQLVEGVGLGLLAVAVAGEDDAVGAVAVAFGGGRAVAGRLDANQRDVGGEVGHRLAVEVGGEVGGGVGLLRVGEADGGEVGAAAGGVILGAAR